MKCVPLYSLSKYKEWKMYKTMQRQNKLQWFRTIDHLRVINDYTNNNYNDKNNTEILILCRIIKINTKWFTPDKVLVLKK